MPGGKPNILVTWGAEFPPRQRAASFTIDQAVEKLNDFLASRGG